MGSVRVLSTAKSPAVSPRIDDCAGFSLFDGTHTFLQFGAMLRAGFKVARQGAFLSALAWQNEGVDQFF